MLLSADRFVSTTVESGVDAAQRASLLERFGLFGLRLACRLVIEKRAETSRMLVSELRQLSGLDALTDTIHTHFGARADVLRARSALLAVATIVQGVDTAVAAPLRLELERISSNVHEFAEIQLLNAIRAGIVTLPQSDVERAESLLGAGGMLAHQRLGAPADMPGPELANVAHELHRHWQQLAENPLVARATVDAARTLLRTCEGLVAGLAPRS